ncbi:MAG TPA: substrate-binding domain-containing protein [Galbitalea sp.]
MTESGPTNAPLTLFSALAVQGALDDVLLPRFLEQNPVELAITYDPTTVLVELVRGGARPDVIIAVTAALDDLVEAAAIDRSTVVPIARAGVGVAVARGEKVPVISTPESLQRALLDARSVAYSRAGASGIYFAELIERLGIGEQVNAKATIVEKGFTALAIVDGRADLAIQQLSELKFVPEVAIVGPLPEATQHYTEFSVALGAAAADTPAALALLRLLAEPSSAVAFRDAGLLAGPDRL